MTTLSPDSQNAAQSSAKKATKMARIAGSLLLVLCALLLVQAFAYSYFQRRDSFECRTRSGQLLRLRYLPSISSFRAGCEYKVYTEGNPVARASGNYPRTHCEALLDSYRSEGACGPLPTRPVRGFSPQ